MKICGIIAKQEANDNKIKIHIQTFLAKGRYSKPGSNLGGLGFIKHKNLSIKAGTKEITFVLSKVIFQADKVNGYFPATTSPNTPFHSPLRLKGP